MISASIFGLLLVDLSPLNLVDQWIMMLWPPLAKILDPQLKSPLAFDSEFKHRQTHERVEESDASCPYSAGSFGAVVPGFDDFFASGGHSSMLMVAIILIFLLNNCLR